MRSTKFFFLLVLVLVFLQLGIGVNATSTKSASITASTYDRITVSRVDITISYQFQLDNNYTTLKLVFLLYPSELPVGIYIATKTVDYSSYNNATSGTTGLVTGSTVLTAYDSYAKDVNIFDNDKVYLFLGIYNSTIATGNFLVSQSTTDVDYWPPGSKYSKDSSGAVTEEDTTPTILGLKWYYYGAIVIGLVLLVVGVGLLSEHFYPPNNAPKRDTLVYDNGRKVWAKRDKNGRFTDIQDPGHAMTRDRAQPHMYKQEKHSKDGRYIPGADRRSDF